MPGRSRRARPCERLPRRLPRSFPEGAPPARPPVGRSSISLAGSTRVSLTTRTFSGRAAPRDPGKQRARRSPSRGRIRAVATRPWRSSGSWAMSSGGELVISSDVFMPTSGTKVKVMPVDRDAIDRARMRLAQTGEERPDDAAPAGAPGARAGRARSARADDSRARDGDPREARDLAPEGPPRRGAASGAPPREVPRTFGSDIGALERLQTDLASDARRGGGPGAARRPDHLRLARRREAPLEPDGASARPASSANWTSGPTSAARCTASTGSSPAPSRSARQAQLEAGPFPDLRLERQLRRPRACASSRAIGRRGRFPRPQRDQKGRKIRSRSSARCRGPVSDTETATVPFVARRPRSIRPPSGVQAKRVVKQVGHDLEHPVTVGVRDGIGVERALVFDARAGGPPRRSFRRPSSSRASQLDLLLLERGTGVASMAARDRGRRRRGV
jgi:hypothetical protein